MGTAKLMVCGGEPAQFAVVMAWRVRVCRKRRAIPLFKELSIITSSIAM